LECRRLVSSVLVSSVLVSTTLVSAAMMVATLETAAQEAPVPSTCRAWTRLLPPEGLEVPADRKTLWEQKLSGLHQGLSTITNDALRSDVSVLAKACRYALDHREFYSEKDFDKVDRLLSLAEGRLGSLSSGENPPWTKADGLVVRGFQSKVDGSPQPVGLILPEGWSDSQTKYPLYVWLHGRGDKSTDLHFLCERMDKKGEVAPSGAIVLHPFGRQCIGYKSAAETDVLEAIQFAIEQYPVDVDRIVLIGFSMGGAGVWHLAAHHTDRFVAASPGAGFAETARYRNLKPADYPAEFEQRLWRVYDVPRYTRNLFNIPVVAYSGENDKQIQAARVMEEAFQQEGRRLTHLIGPGMGHKYHPDVLKDILERLKQVADEGIPKNPTQLYLQTHHLRYAQRRWITVDGFERAYEDTRVDARLDGDRWRLATQNVSRLKLEQPPSGPYQRPSGPYQPPCGRYIELDGQVFPLGQGPSRWTRLHSQWRVADDWPTMRKSPGLSGPIDDAFLDPFLVVVPSGKAQSAVAEGWVRCELAHFMDRWKALFRGDLRIKSDSDVTDEDMRRYHLVLWGDHHGNRILARLAQSANWPLRQRSGQWSIGQRSWSVDKHMPVLIYPNPLASRKYVVVNSGPTFREGHDSSNSIQNPKLPDWAIIGLDEAPSAQRPGRIVQAAFFDDSWSVQ
jgi:dienelactone hydrolase